MDLASPYNHKCPLCTLVSKCNVKLAQPLQCFTGKSLPGDRRFYFMPDNEIQNPMWLDRHIQNNSE